jgi:hypothetical protein
MKFEFVLSKMEVFYYPKPAPDGPLLRETGPATSLDQKHQIAKIAKMMKIGNCAS